MFVCPSWGLGFCLSSQVCSPPSLGLSICLGVWLCLRVSIWWRCLSSWVALYQGVHLSRVLSPCPSGCLLQCLSILLHVPLSLRVSPCPSGCLLGRVCPPLWVLISPLGCLSVPLGVPLSFWGVCPYFWASICPWRCLPECTLILLGLHLPPSWWPSVPRSLCPHVPPPPPDTTYMPLPTMYEPCAHLPLLTLPCLLPPRFTPLPCPPQWVPLQAHCHLPRAPRLAGGEAGAGGGPRGHPWRLLG